MEEYKSLTADEIFFIFKEEHRLCSPLDPEADPTFDLQPTSTIEEWRDSMDLLPTHPLAKALNSTLTLEVPLESWKAVLEPPDQRTVYDVCNFISQFARIEIVQPVKLLGQTCISAALFRSLHKNLQKRGIDTAGLRPSSDLEPFLRNHFGEFVGYINTAYAGVIPSIHKKRTVLNTVCWLATLFSVSAFLAALVWDFSSVIVMISVLTTISLWFLNNRLFKRKAGMIGVPGVVTFRDLINRIVAIKFAADIDSKN